MAATDDSRFRARAMAVLSAVALGLALVGIYGVVAYSISQRTREIGIRIALGASRRHVVRLSVGAGLVPAVVGAAAACRPPPSRRARFRAGFTVSNRSTP